MSRRQIPVRPNIVQLRHQAKDLLRDARLSKPEALDEVREQLGASFDLAGLRLADAQLALARSYGVSSWRRLVLVCEVVDAIWRDDVAALRKLFDKHPKLVKEDALGSPSNWGPPMSYAANLGRDEIIELARSRGAGDIQHAFNRACLQGKLDTARSLYRAGARPQPGAVMGPCETQSGSGLALMLELGAELSDGERDRLAPVALALETYCRNPEGKHRCFEIFAANGIGLPDTPPMALHQGRVDLLEENLKRDPGIVNRTYSLREIYPLELGCHHDGNLALCGTPLGGTTLLHMCADYGELEIAQWLLANGADVNRRADVDEDGFGGHTALFGCVVSQMSFTSFGRSDGFARLFLEHGADPSIRANLRKELRFVEDESLHEYRNVTAYEWGERFHGRGWVNPAAMKLIASWPM